MTAPHTNAEQPPTGSQAPQPTRRTGAGHTGAAPDAAGQDGPPGAAPRLGLIGLVVADMAASLAFYRRLGVESPPEADAQPHVEAVLPGGLRLAWDTVETVRSFDPDWAPATGSRISLAFDCGSPAGVDARYAELTEAGHTGRLKPWDAFWGQRYAVVHDPDGNAVDLYAASDSVLDTPSGVASDTEPAS